MGELVEEVAPATARRPGDAGGAVDVSVVVPVFDAGKYLEPCLRSILEQDLGEVALEVIAIDDGSTDGSSEVLLRARVQDPRVRVLRQSNSGWAGAPRNRGIELARGRYIFFCDADDLLGPQAVARMVRFADEHGCDVVVPRLVGLGGRFVHEFTFEELQIDAELLRLVHSNTPQKLFRSSFVAQHGLRFPEEPIRLEDAIFVFRAYALASRVSILNDYEYYFLRTREDSGNISHGRLDPKEHPVAVRRALEALGGGRFGGDELAEARANFFRRTALRRYGEGFAAKPVADRRAWLKSHRDIAQSLVDVDAAARTYGHRDRALLWTILDGDLPAVSAGRRWRAAYVRLLSLRRCGSGVGLELRTQVADGMGAVLGAELLLTSAGEERVLPAALGDRTRDVAGDLLQQPECRVHVQVGRRTGLGPGPWAVALRVTGEHATTVAPVVVEGPLRRRRLPAHRVEVTVSPEGEALITSSTAHSERLRSVRRRVRGRWRRLLRRGRPS